MIIYDMRPYYKNIIKALGDQYSYFETFESQVRRMGFKSFRFNTDIPRPNNFNKLYSGAYEMDDEEYTWFILRFS